MNTTRLPLAMADSQSAIDTRLIHRIARKGLLKKLGALRAGRIEIIDAQDRYSFGSPSEQFPASIHIQVRDPAFYADVAFAGSVGAGESYMHGAWECDNLVDLIRLLIVNREVLNALDSGSALLSRPLLKLFHFLHRNTLKGSRENIHAHYDLGNEFFKLFLDPTMMYSSAVFKHPEMSLQDASVAKLDRICEKLELTSEDHVLEIGTGWGGFAIHAAQKYGCRVTTTTISDAQYQLARERVEQAGLEGRITLLKQDFRSLDGKFDKLVSVEMIEAIGESNIGHFFDVCDRCLEDDGRMLLQAITINDQLYQEYRKSVDFIQRFIFPGGFLPSLGLLAQQIGKRSQMRVLHLEDLGTHYARTLREWRQNFGRNSDAIARLGHDEIFQRLWQFYFCYCEAGFTERTTGVLQMLLAKESDRSEIRLAF